ncbi:HAD superfamily hydrolase (TIGR01509 family) [Sphingomonas vulcanisoli]|uniref:HAD superfamily hydrolase (TIGR01509 family) n=1 Tax=Sphingomonas vulcanisoli TaxID=1658060 RepID=A0ABX0TPC9_9SPHN|nr:HAD family phosphatase [Sphingomonas vulcanisoli]NIJ07389.1 HAD superfamily hydrolase (TIGR01509 family) [Sphingomonas vulcanisoli]
MSITVADRFAAILFDFDGVLIESEYAGNLQIAETLTRLGHPTTPQQSMTHFMGLAANEFLAAVEHWIGRPIPNAFYDDREAENRRALSEGIDAVAGAIAFVDSLPANLPIAITSSSTTDWIRAHLAHIGLLDRFEGRIYSGREHVTRGKPAPDLYLHAAAQLGVPIARCLIIEDSPVGATGAVASGATVVGFCAGTHCPIDHADVLRAKGVQRIAADFGEVAAVLAGNT